jgi:hypothetical protein
MTLRRRRDFGLLLASVLPFSAIATSVSVPSQAATPASLSEGLTGDAKAAYAAGILLFKNGDAEGALTKFRRAFELSRDVRLLWNMSICEKTLRHYGKAYALLSRYLKDGGATLPADDVNAAKDALVALRSFYSLVTPRVQPAGARLFVDGEAVGVAPFAEGIAVDLGRHLLRAEAPGYEAAEQPIEVPGATDLVVTFDLKAIATSSRLAVVAGASDAILIDGKTVAVGRFDGVVAAGIHSVRVTGSGKKAYDSRIDLASGAIRTVDVSLEPDTSGGVPAWAWIAGGAVVAGGVAVGGYFLFRPSDQVAQSGATGRLGTLYLQGFSGVRF